jgi:hypothetical protein
MNLVRDLAGFAIMACAVFGQNPGELFSKAPPDIDEALRSRITNFYQAHVEGKYRAADQMVAEDSKDIFFAAEKQHCRAFQIMKITYAENFTRAVVLTTCDTEVVVVMAGRIPVKMPLRSLWKTIDGQWFWYADPVVDKETVTPFGLHKPSTTPEQPAGPATFPGPVSLGSVSSMVQPDRQSVDFDPAKAATERVVLKSAMPGSVALSVQTPIIAGLEVKLDPTSIGPGESAVLSIHFEPATGLKLLSGVVSVLVEPTMQHIPIQIRFR